MSKYFCERYSNKNQTMVDNKETNNIKKIDKYIIRRINIKTVINYYIFEHLKLKLIY